MSVSLFFALLVNAAVGAWFAWGYPRSVKRAFAGQPPRGFALLARILPPIGIAIMIASIGYGIAVTIGFL